MAKEPKPAAAATRVADLKPGMSVDGTFLVKKKIRREQNNGSAFLLFQLTDASGQINAILWHGADIVDERVAVGDLVHVRGQVQLHQKARQIRLLRVDPADTAATDLEAYLPQSAHDTEERWARLEGYLEQVANPWLQQLYRRIFADPETRAAFAMAPAGKAWHHAYVGGLLDHVLSMLELGEALARAYPSIDRDLMVGGILLHDIGKIEELRWQPTFEYTESGRLVGHLVQGCVLVARHLDAIEGFPEDLRSRVLHTIVSHHGSLERGSPKPPMTLEATAVHLLDHLDSQVQAVSKVVEGVHAADGWSDHVRLVDRAFFAGRPDAADDGPDPA